MRLNIRLGLCRMRFRTAPPHRSVPGIASALQCEDKDRLVGNWSFKFKSDFKIIEQSITEQGMRVISWDIYCKTLYFRACVVI